MADLSKTNLQGADLREANLWSATLSEADLSGTDLTGAYRRFMGEPKELITKEWLEKQTKSLEGATMPDGQLYEDWLKSEGRGGEEGENSGSS